MPRVKASTARRQKHKKVLKSTRGMFGSASRRYKIAKQAAFRAGVYATRDRRHRKREFRRLWITRITAACEQRGTKYSRFMYGLEEAGMKLNRKMLSEIAIADPAGFDKIVETALAAIPA